jgi:hypothetical protein
VRVIWRRCALTNTGDTVANDSQNRGWHGSTVKGFLAYLDKAERTRTSEVLTILKTMLELQSPDKNDPAAAIAHNRILLDNELSKYKFVPDLLPRKNGGWGLEWRVLRVAHRKLSPFEASALQMVLAFATAGKLKRLRKCGDCSKWMYARFPHQNFCSMNCQQSNYRHSEAGRLMKRNAMKRYRLRDAGGRRRL